MTTITSSHSFQQQATTDDILTLPTPVDSFSNLPTDVPVVWSVDGPVCQLGVDPLPNVQSKSSRPTDLFALGTLSQVQKLFCSKSQLPVFKK